MGTIVKWAIGGAIVGFIYWMFNYKDVDFLVALFLGAGVSIMILLAQKANIKLTFSGLNNSRFLFRISARPNKN
ncbi:hypothetical protein [Brevibacillus choshinensis]|uniref:Uncharacterized protein n=1 Tax=Brevibacillus choshinensis TaxID=54911 RepID=A0ABX7FM58_BRECH|nr:hypothetical protein [Brevibacillus choshinensis]QRG67338.1 hypothetical protein JNE38_28520 [Brevibacillus choshinensis]